MPLGTRPGTRPLFGLGVLAALALAILAYPRPAQTTVSEAYTALSHSSVPVEVVGWLQPTEAHAQMVDDGYVLTEQTDSFGELTVAGNRDPGRLPPAPITWQEAGFTYTLQGSADPDQLRARVVPLQVAQQQLSGASIDIPLLYVVYLPVSVLAIGWLTVSLLRRN